VAAPSQRRALGTLFLVLCLGFAGVAYAAAVAHVWPVVAAAALLALWMGSLMWQMLGRRT
jgi:hypothetical protein